VVNGSARPAWPTVLADGAVAVVAGACALSSFGAAYGGRRYLLVGAVGLVVGAVVTVIGIRRRQSVLTMVAEVLVGYFVVGGPLATPSESFGRVLPTPSSVHALATVAVTGWADLLSTSPVIGDAGHLLAVPLLCGLLCGAATVLVAGRLPRSPVALVPSFVLLSLGIVFGTTARPSLLALDAVLAAILFGWAAWRARSARPDGIASTARRRPATGTAVLAAGAVLGLLVGPVLPGSTSHLRYALRDHIPPPFDVHRYPSPLAAYRHYVLPTEEGNTAIVRVTGAPAGSLLRIATMDDYDGIVFGVAGGAPGSTASGNFATVGNPVSSDPCPTSVHCTTATVGVQLLHYANVWLPDVGTVRTVAFDGRNASALRNAFRYNVATNAAVVSTGVAAPDRYRLVATIPAEPPASVMNGAQAATVSLPSFTNVPPVVQEKAHAIAGTAHGAYAEAEALSNWLSTQGAYSDGAASSPPSLPGDGEYRIAQFLGQAQPVGDAEQYAAAMDLMARSLGLPARVVLGVRLLPGTHTYVGKDVTAWVEVDFVGVGWYPFFPTPPVNATTRSTPPPPAPSTSQQAQYQPPASDQAGNGAVPASATTNTVARPHHNTLVHDTWLLVRDILLALLAVAVLAGPPLLVAWAKAHRRRQRRSSPSPVARMEGGWAEVIDRARDVGRAPPPHATRRQAAVVVGGSSLGVAERADRASFGPEMPDHADADALWANVDVVLAELEADLSRWVRLRARVDPRSLLRRDGSRARGRGDGR